MVGFERMTVELDELMPPPDPAQRGRGWYEWPTVELLAPPRDHPQYATMWDTWMVEGHKRVLSPLLCLTYALAAMAYVLTAGYFRNDRVMVVTRLIAAMLVAHLGLFAALPFAARLAPVSLGLFHALAVGGALACWVVLARSDRRLARPGPARGGGRLGRLVPGVLRAARR